MISTSRSQHLSWRELETQDKDMSCKHKKHAGLKHARHTNACQESPSKHPVLVCLSAGKVCRSGSLIVKCRQNKFVQIMCFIMHFIYIKCEMQTLIFKSIYLECTWSFLCKSKWSLHIPYHKISIIVLVWKLLDGNFLKWQCPLKEWSCTSGKF